MASTKRKADHALRIDCRAFMFIAHAKSLFLNVFPDLKDGDFYGAD